ncbi:MAG: c-type cytochrome [Myxococcales bacterium]|jgi:mono/diheme cytochrome c family protein
MIRTLKLASMLLALGWATTSAAEPILPGDAVRGRALYKRDCAACHGAERRGDGPLAVNLKNPEPADLRNPELLMQRSDADLHKTIAQGGAAAGAHFTMPAFGERAGELNAWDLVAFLRDGQVTVLDFFPGAASFTAKEYAFDKSSLERLAPVLGALPEAEARMSVITVFKGKKAADGPVFVPDDPRLLDSLKPKAKLGYLAFAAIAFPELERPLSLAIALDRDGAIKSLRPELAGLDDKARDRVKRLLAGYERQGGKGQEYKALKPPKTSPKDAKPAAEVATALTRVYYRALEGAVMFDKEERERHWAD